jgi:hypothetical protein
MSPEMKFLRVGRAAKPTTPMTAEEAGGPLTTGRSPGMTAARRARLMTTVVSTAWARRGSVRASSVDALLDQAIRREPTIATDNDPTMAGTIRTSPCSSCFITAAASCAEALLRPPVGELLLADVPAEEHGSSVLGMAGREVDGP